MGQGKGNKLTFLLKKSFVVKHFSHYLFFKLAKTFTFFDFFCTFQNFNNFFYKKFNWAKKCFQRVKFFQKIFIIFSVGFVQEGLDHLAMAIVLCNKPSQVMTIFRQTLSEEHFNLLIESVPRAKQVKKIESYIFFQ